MVLTLISQLHRLCDMTEAILALPEKRRPQFAMKQLQIFASLKSSICCLSSCRFFASYTVLNLSGADVLAANSCRQEPHFRESTSSFLEIICSIR
jgi:hypothetical protein